MIWRIAVMQGSLPREHHAGRAGASARFGGQLLAVLLTGAALAGVAAGASQAQTDPSSTTAVTTTVAPTTGAPTTVAETTTTAAPTTSSVAPSTTSAVGASTTTSTTVPAALIPRGRVLKTGAKGPDVLALELRLSALRYDVGKVDGRFDQSTWQGVVAFQKVNVLKRTGKVDDVLKATIESSAMPTGLVPNGGANRIEVDISRQVLFLYLDGTLNRVVSISSGSGRKYCDTSGLTGEPVCGKATTPRGSFRIQRRIPGWRESDLGKLYNPLYFTGGFAFHGAPSVPAYPASHGCVRLPMPVAEWFPDLVKNGTRVYLYD
jgi:peptidoglycan hydrolase-like protein with peptidoglycan-binding domain